MMRSFEPINAHHWKLNLTNREVSYRCAVGISENKSVKGDIGLVPKIVLMMTGI